MKLSDYSEFPADIPVIAEDELFLYPFMISPLFLSDDSNIKAATKAIEEGSKSSFLKNLQASAAPCSRTIPLSSHSTDMGPV